MKAIAETRPELGVEIIDAPMPHRVQTKSFSESSHAVSAARISTFTYGNSAPTAPFPGCLPSSAMSRPAKSSNSAPA